MENWFSESPESTPLGQSQVAGTALSQESFDQAKLNFRNKEKFSAAATRAFNAADSNHNGELTRNELYNAIENNHSIKGQDAQALVAMAVIANHGDNKDWENGRKGITRANIQSYGDILRLPVGENDLTRTAQRSIERTAQAQQYTSELFSQKFYPALSIKFEDVKQGYSGACEFLAPLASLAAKRPAEIAEMITDNHDGTYTVKFPYLKQPIKVSAPTEAERGLFAQGSVHGTWPSVMEKAYRRSVQVMTGKPWTEDSLGQTSTWNGGFQTLTGIVPTSRDISVDNTDLSDNRIEELLIDAMKRSAVMEVGRHKDPKFFSKRTEDIPDAHAYSILNYDQATKRVTIRNPWGEGEPEFAKDKPKDGKDDGVFSMTLQEFRKNFDRIMIE